MAKKSQDYNSPPCPRHTKAIGTSEFGVKVDRRPQLDQFQKKTPKHKGKGSK